MSERKEGFYWVVFLPEIAEEWTVAEWFNNRWWAVGLEEVEPDEDILVGEFIGEPRLYHRTRDSA